MAVGEARPGYELWRPNREKPEAITTKYVIVLLLLASAIPHIVRDALYLYSANSSYDDLVEFKSWVAYRFVEIVVAVWLIVGTGGFVKVFRWARSAGSKKAL